MAQDAQLGIGDTLNAEGRNLLGACDGYLAVTGDVGLFVELELEPVHILIIITAQDVVVCFFSRVDEEDTCIDIVGHLLGQLVKRVQRDAVLVDVAVERDTIGHTVGLRVEVENIAGAVTGDIVRAKASCLQGIQFTQGSISVRIVASLVHIRLGQVHLGHHSIH